MTTTATLTITGPMPLIAKIADELGKKYPDGLYSTTDQRSESHAAWTKDGASALLDSVADRQRQLLEQLIAGGGVLDLDEFRKGNGALKGLTGPIQKWINSLISRGLVAEGTQNPLVTIYDTENPSNQRAKQIRMKPEALDVFRAAAKSSGGRHA